MHPQEYARTRARTYRPRARVPAMAAYAGISKSLADKMRLDGSGPPYSKVGDVVVYDLDDVDQWLDARKRRSTSEPEPKRRAGSSR
jgi:predicted DNA-binding transcriptional regulator AlpA